MTKKSFICFIFLCVFLLNLSESLHSASKHSNPRFFIKLRGGLNFLDGGVFSDMIDEDRVYFDSLINSEKDYVITTDADSFFTGYGAEIGLEAGIYAVGIEIGNLTREYFIDYTYRDPEVDYQAAYLWDQKFSAVPIFVNHYFKIINGKFITSFLILGGGVYLSKVALARYETFVNAPVTFVNTIVEGKRNFLGLNLALTIEFNFTSNVALFIDAKYRYVGFKNYSGTLYFENDNTTSELEGDLLYLINKDSGKGKFWVGDYDEEVWEEHTVYLNMKGFCLAAGLKIIFGSRPK